MGGGGAILQVHMNRTSRHSVKGFTIVELLIVIVVIAILAAISVVAYTGVQDRARQSKVRSDIAQLTRAIVLARESQSKVLGDITGSYGSGQPCWNKASGTDLAALPTSDNCWVRYNSFLATVSDASGVNVRSIVDPWGRPYLIDENEAETATCYKDTVAMYAYPFTGNVLQWTTRQTVPYSGFSICG